MTESSRDGNAAIAASSLPVNRRDYISQLPDSALVHILSFLPMKEAIRTGVLSKRFAYKWVYTPNIVFNLPYGQWDRTDDFLDFVNRTLLLHDSGVGKFAISMDFLRHSFERLFDLLPLWLRFATRKGVKEMNLSLCGVRSFNWYPTQEVFYLLPQFIFAHSSIKKLTTQLCSLAPRGVVSWNSLKSLSIEYGNVSDEGIHKILMGSPTLEFLKLEKCQGFSRIHICSKNMKKLVIEALWDERNEAVVDISGPYLPSLEISGLWYRTIFRLSHFSSLVKAKLDPCIANIENKGIDTCIETVKESFENLGCAEELMVGNWCIQVLSVMEARELPCPLSKCKHLILETLGIHRSVPGIARLLKSSPDLEKLQINMAVPFEKVWSDENLRGLFKFRDNFLESFLVSQEKDFEFLLQNLKIIEISGFKIINTAGWVECNVHCVLALSKFLLKNAKVLEKLIISPIMNPFAYFEGVRESVESQLLELVSELQNFPTASPVAAVSFSKDYDTFL